MNLVTCTENLAVLGWIISRCRWESGVDFLMEHDPRIGAKVSSCQWQLSTVNHLDDQWHEHSVRQVLFQIANVNLLLSTGHLVGRSLIHLSIFFTNAYCEIDTSSKINRQSDSVVDSWCAPVNRRFWKNTERISILLHLFLEIKTRPK